MELITSTICKTKDLGVHGNMFGGILLSLLDESGAIFCAKIADTGKVATLDTHCRGLRNKKREYIKKENRTRTIEQDYSYLKEKIECIDFNKRGWRLIMGGKLNITPQRAGEIIKKYFPEIWEKAYKHLTTK
jgi:hypothetical protein